MTAPRLRRCASLAHLDVAKNGEEGQCARPNRPAHTCSDRIGGVNVDAACRSCLPRDRSWRLGDLLVMRRKTLRVPRASASAKSPRADHATAPSRTRPAADRQAALQGRRGRPPPHEIIAAHLTSSIVAQRERDVRSETENIVGALGLAAANELAAHGDADLLKVVAASRHNVDASKVPAQPCLAAGRRSIIVNLVIIVIFHEDAEVKQSRLSGRRLDSCWRQGAAV